VAVIAVTVKVVVFAGAVGRVIVIVRSGVIVGRGGVGAQEASSIGSG
jgi:hypothetical protein